MKNRPTTGGSTNPGAASQSRYQSRTPCRTGGDSSRNMSVIGLAPSLAAKYARAARLAITSSARPTASGKATSASRGRSAQGALKYPVTVYGELPESMAFAAGKKT